MIKLGGRKNCPFKLDFFCYYLVAATAGVQNIKQHDNGNQLGGEDRLIPEIIIPPFVATKILTTLRDFHFLLPYFGTCSGIVFKALRY
jgi:hypothetical protein